jgi:hypothetical protein
VINVFEAIESEYTEVADLYHKTKQLFPDCNKVEIKTQGRKFVIDNNSIHEQGKSGEWGIRRVGGK